MARPALLLLAAAAYAVKRRSAKPWRFLEKLGLFAVLVLAIRRRSRRALLEPSLTGQVAVVTGASRGIGKGIAVGLGEAGATVYATGRSLVKGLNETKEAVERAGGKCIIVACDNGDDAQLEKLFARVMEEQGRLDVLVNVAFSAVDTLPKFVGMPFWEKGVDLWDQVNHVGLRSHYVATLFATRHMSKAKRGLIVNVSSLGGMNYIFDAAYGVGKAAMDRMANDMAIELATENITMISLWPGLVKTEYVEETPGDFSRLQPRRGLPPGQPAMDTAAAMPTPLAETPLFNGRVVAALARDTKRQELTGKVCMTASLALDYGVVDERGVRTPPLLSLKGFLSPALRPMLEKRGAWTVPGGCYDPQPGLTQAASRYWNDLPDFGFPPVLVKLMSGNACLHG